MPYAIRKQAKQFCVYKKDGGETVKGGCHFSKKAAEGHMRALYANVDEAKKTEK